jgi:hypothetical protein
MLAHQRVFPVDLIDQIGASVGLLLLIGPLLELRGLQRSSAMTRMPSSTPRLEPAPLLDTQQEPTFLNM